MGASWKQDALQQSLEEYWNTGAPSPEVTRQHSVGTLDWGQKRLGGPRDGGLNEKDGRRNEPRSDDED